MGVVADVGNGLEGPVAETFYVPLAQNPRGRMNLLVRMARGASGAPAAVASAIRAFDPDLPAPSQSRTSSF